MTAGGSKTGTEPKTPSPGPPSPAVNPVGQQGPPTDAAASTPDGARRRPWAPPIDYRDNRQTTERWGQYWAPIGGQFCASVDNLDGQEWIFHSQTPVWIAPEHWISGYFHPAEVSFHERLELADGEYIDIQIPRFMAEAIWSPPAPAPLEPTEYSTPYLELITRAIAENRIDEWDQSKKIVLVDWFKSQTVEGEPLSGHLANAMATIIRLPSSQRGGGKRV